MVKSVKINVNGKRVRRKSYKKRALSKKEKNEVTRIAKKVFKQNVEHKYFVQGLTDATFLCGNIYAFNPMGLITYGTSEGSRIGEVINHCRLRVKLSWISLGTKIDIPNYHHLWNRASLRVMVIRTKRQLTGNNGAWVDITTLIGMTNSAAARDQCIFYQPTGWAYPYHSGLSDVRKDNDFKVVYDKTIKSDNDNPYTAITGGNGTYVPNGKFTNLKFSAKIGKFEYEESNVAYASKGYDNVYVLAMPYIPRTIAGTDIAGDITAHYSLTWTDA